MDELRFYEYRVNYFIPELDEDDFMTGIVVGTSYSDAVARLVKEHDNIIDFSIMETNFTNTYPIDEETYMNFAYKEG